MKTFSQIYILISGFILVMNPVSSHAQSNDQNYIIKRIYTSETTYNDLIDYYDGLGRPCESVEKGITPSGKDLVSKTDYDSYGREYKTWLPISNSGSGNYVNDVSSLSSQQYADSYGFAQTNYENSPLERITSKCGPGSSWATSNRSVKKEYLTNSSSDNTLKCILYGMDGDALKNTVIIIPVNCL